MKKEKFCKTLSVTLTLLSLTLLLTTANAQISAGATFTVRVTFDGTASLAQPFPSSGEVTQGVQTADYGGGAYFPPAVKIVAVSQGSTREWVTVKVAFEATGNLLQPFPSSAEVAQAIQSTDYAGGAYIPGAVQIVAVRSGADIDQQNLDVIPSGNPACAASQDLIITIETVGTPITNLDEFSCTASEGRWSFGFSAAGDSKKASIEVQYAFGQTVYQWQRPVVPESNVVYHGCDGQGSNCWQFERIHHFGWACTNCNPAMSNLYLLGMLTFPATLDDAPGPDLIEPNGASGTN